MWYVTEYKKDEISRWREEGEEYLDKRKALNRLDTDRENFASWLLISFSSRYAAGRITYEASWISRDLLRRTVWTFSKQWNVISMRASSNRLGIAIDVCIEDTKHVWMEIFVFSLPTNLYLEYYSSPCEANVNAHALFIRDSN